MPALLPGLDNLAQDNSPCPQANGTQIGSIQQFTLLCGSNVVGDTINTPDGVQDFGGCADRCASFHPKCEAISFNGHVCQLKGNVRFDQTHPAKFFNAAVANFPTAASNCGSLGQTALAGATTYSLSCGKIINGNDMSQAFASSFQDCLNQCNALSGCAAISYDASMGQGFKNCYLKSQTDPSAPIVDVGIDSALVQKNNAPQASTPSSTAVSDPAPAPTTTTPVPAPETTAPAPETTDTAAVPPSMTFFTPQPSTTGVLTIANPTPTDAAPSVTTIISVITSGLATVSETEIVTAPALTEAGPSPITETLGGGSSLPTDAPSSITSAGDDGASQSRAWIAAPVVGSVAAVVLIALMFVMWGRRRRSSGEKGDGSSSSPKMPSPFNMRFPRGRLGNFSAVTGRKPPPLAAPPSRRASGIRNSVANYWRPGMERIDDEEYGTEGMIAGAVGSSSRAGSSRGLVSAGGEDEKRKRGSSKLELRFSQNGLGQNSWLGEAPKELKDLK